MDNNNHEFDKQKMQDFRSKIEQIFEKLNLLEACHIDVSTMRKEMEQIKRTLQTLEQSILELEMQIQKLKDELEELNRMKEELNCFERRAKAEDD